MYLSKTNLVARFKMFLKLLHKLGYLYYTAPPPPLVYICFFATDASKIRQEVENTENYIIEIKRENDVVYI